MVRIRTGDRKRVGIFFTGRDQEIEAEDLGDSQEEFALFGEEK